ncbi:MAG: choice-of-anchor Q domain-containing protein, partial [Phycisphaerales bacterium]
MRASTNNIDVDPQFMNWEEGNFRLAALSPCIDAGTNRDWMSGAKDLDGNARIIGPSVDMGAYEYEVGAITVTPFSVTNFLMQGNSVLVPFTLRCTDSNYGLYWSVRLTSDWVQASASNGYIGPGGTETVYLTNNATGLAGTYASRAWFVATNNPNNNTTSGRVDMALNVNSMTLSPSNMTNSVQAGLNAMGQSFYVMSSGKGLYYYTVTTNNAVDWLIVTNYATYGMLDAKTQTVYLAYTTTALASGLHTGVVAVATTNGGGQTNLLYVVMNVMGLTVSPANLFNTVIKGYNATSQTFGVSAGGGSMAYTISTNAGWLGVRPASGVVAGSATNVVTNIYHTADLDAGEYHGQVSVVSVEGGGATGQVEVTMTVLPTPVIGVSPAVVTQVIERGTSPTSDVFEVWNNSAAPVLSLAYNVSVTSAFIQGLSPSDGVVSGQHARVGISYRNLTGFEAGIYTAVVAVAMTNSGAGYGGSWSGTSNLTVVMVIAAPDSPGVLRATKGDYEEKVGLSWSTAVSPVGGSVSYQVLRHTTFDASYAQTIVSGLTATNFDDTSALPGARYYYWVRSVNRYGYNGTNSMPDSGYRRLSAPDGLFASDGAYTNKITLSWAEVDGAGSYYVYRGAGGAVGIVQHTAGLEYDDNMVLEGVEYTYYVQATNAICGSVLSGGERGYVLGRPVSVSASDGAYVGKVVVSWGAVNGATAYEVWRSTQTLMPPYGGGAKLKEQAATTYEDTAVTAGERYYYWLKSKNSTALSAFSEREEGFAATAAVDLSLSRLLIQPRRVGVGANPAVVSFRLQNNGGADMTGADGTVRMTFYASGNSVFGDGDDQVIGSVDEQLELGIGLKGIFNVGGGNVRLPAAAGNYYIFMSLSPVWPSTLAPAAAGGWVTGRAWALEVSPAGSLNYQALNDFDGDGMSDLITHGSGYWDGESVDGIEYARDYPFGG